MLACIVGNDLQSVALADKLAIEAVLAVFNILENGLLVLGIPADYIDKAGFVAKLAANALLGIEFDTMISVYQSVYPLINIVSLFSAFRLTCYLCVQPLKPWASGQD